MVVAGTRWGICCRCHRGRAAGGSLPPVFEGGGGEILPALQDSGVWSSTGIMSWKESQNLSGALVRIQ
jgi:hypothetical protein